MEESERLDPPALSRLVIDHVRVLGWQGNILRHRVDQSVGPLVRLDLVAS